MEFQVSCILKLQIHRIAIAYIGFRERKGKNMMRNASVCGTAAYLSRRKCTPGEAAKEQRVQRQKRQRLPLERSSSAGFF